MDDTRARIAQLEELVSELRHDLRGALASTRLVTDRMRGDADPRMQKFGTTIDRATQRILDRLDDTKTLVPPRIPLMEQ
jgi:signal transduction histidine kinase